jgi:hypothetical protein
MDAHRLLHGPWPARITWAALPLTVAPTLEAAFDGRSRPVQIVAATLAWAAWTGVLVAVALPRTTSLTALRTAAPAVLGVALWAGVTGDDPGPAEVVGLAWAAVVVLAAFAPTTGEAFVNGSAYGDERRMPLRIPAAVAAGPVVLAWAAVVAPVVTGPLLLASEAWVAGVAVSAAGVPLAALGARALHGLARRWLVFVPAGLVVHDPMALADPVLFTRTRIARFGPAPADTDAMDLTRGALGLALELELVEPTTVVPRPWPSGRAAAPPPVAVTRLLVAPTRPGAVLSLAADRSIPVG